MKNRRLTQKEVDFYNPEYYQEVQFDQTESHSQECSENAHEKYSFKNNFKIQNFNLFSPPTKAEAASLPQNNVRKIDMSLDHMVSEISRKKNESIKNQYEQEKLRKN